MFDQLLQGIKSKINPVQQQVGTGISSAISSAAKVFPTVGNFVQKQAQQWQQKEANQLATKIATQAGNAYNGIKNSYYDVAENPQNKLSQAFGKVNLPVSSPLIPNQQANIPVGNLLKDMIFKTRDQGKERARLITLDQGTASPEDQRKSIDEFINLSMMMGINTPNAVKTVNPNLLTENVAPKIKQNFMKVKGSNQADFVAGESGVSKVKEIGKKKLEELFPVKKEVLPNTGLQLPSGEVPKPPLALPEGVNPTKEAINVTDTSWFNQKTLEPKRFFKKVLPQQLQSTVDETIFKPLNQLRGQAAKMKNAYDTQLKSFGNEFKVGSEYSKLTQQYGEGVITKDQLVAKLGPDGATKIENAKNFFRQAYDDLLKTINTNRAAAGMDVITPRPDYFRHMAELGTDENALSRILNGGSGATGVKSKGIFKFRKGDQTEYDAVGGFINYLDRAGRAAFTDTISPTIKNLAKKLEKGGAPRQAVDYMNNYSDQILGITQNEGALVNSVNKVASKMRGSQVLGNVSSIVNQTASLPIAINEAGWGNYLKGFTSKEAAVASKTSPYLLDRAQRTSTSLLSGADAIKGKMGAVLQDADVAATSSMWRAFYEKAKGTGVQDAVQYADDAVESIVGTRGVGGYSEWQQSKLGQLLAPFTSEATVAGNKILELVGQKKAGVLIGIAVTNYLFNTATQSVTGQRPAFDPIDASIDSYRLATGDDKTPSNKIQAATRIAVEALQLNPIAQSIVSNTYSLAELTGKVPDSRDVFGSEDPTRMNVGNLYNPLSNVKDITGIGPVDLALGVGSKFVPGGNQIMKTASGIKSNIEGVAKSKAGNTLFETPKGIVGQAQAAVFGPWSTKEAKDYFANQFNRPLTADETKAYESLSPEQKTKFMQQVQAGNQAENKVNSQINEDGTYKGGQVNPNLTSTNPKVQAAEKKRINSIMDSGITPSDLDIEFKYFKDIPSGKKGEVSKYKVIDDVLTDKNLTQEQKDAVLRVSKLNPQDLQYYQNASLDNSERRRLLLQATNQEDRNRVIITLLTSKRQVANKSLLNSEDITYLYDQGAISKEEKEVLNAINYDEVANKFYVKRSILDAAEKSKSSAATKVKKAKAALVKKSLSSVMNTKAPKLPTLTSAPTKSKTTLTKRWFR